MLTLLRQKLPAETQIDWVVHPSGQGLLENHPLLNQVYPFPGLKLNVTTWDTLQQLRAQRYDWVIDAHGLFKSGLLSALVGSTVRIGMANAREGATLFYTHTIQTGPLRILDRPVAWHYVDMLGGLGFEVPKTLSFPLRSVSETCQNHLKTTRPELMAPQSGPIISLAPKTNWDSKDWPAAYWSELIALILSQTSHPIALLGSPQDTPYLQDILSAANAAETAKAARVHIPSFNLEALHAFMATGPIVIGGDSFPLHLAGATPGVRLIGLYGPTSDVRTGPPPSPNNTARTLLTLPEVLPCQPCHKTRCRIQTHDCLRGLSVDLVFETLLAMLAAAPEGQAASQALLNN
jgi:heptosyltransferase I